MKRTLRTASVIIVGGLLAALSSGCGIVTVDGAPVHTSSHESSANHSTADELKARGRAQARADSERADTRDPLERELLPQQLPVYGSVIDFERAQKLLVTFKESKGKLPGDRIPAEVLLARLRGDLRSAPASKKIEVLALYREARELATDVPAWAGEDDEINVRELRVLVGRLGSLVDFARGRAYPEISGSIIKFGEEYDDYKAKAKHGETPRAKAIFDEVAQIRARFEKDIQRWSEANARLEKDAERNRIGDELSKLENDTSILQSKLGLTGFDTGCDKTSADPIDRQRLTALCPKMTRVHAIIARRYAIEQRYMQPIWPEAAKRARR